MLRQRQGRFDTLLRPNSWARVLGPNALGGVAQQLDLDSNALMGQLVDQLTPDGQLPQAGQLSGGGRENLASMLGGTLRR